MTDVGKCENVLRLLIFMSGLGCLFGQRRLSGQSGFAFAYPWGFAQLHLLPGLGGPARLCLPSSSQLPQCVWVVLFATRMLLLQMGCILLRRSLSAGELEV